MLLFTFCSVNTHKYTYNIMSVCPAVPDADEDPRVTRAKFFIRDEFLVKTDEDLTCLSLSDLSISDLSPSL